MQNPFQLRATLSSGQPSRGQIPVVGEAKDKSGKGTEYIFFIFVQLFSCHTLSHIHLHLPLRQARAVTRVEGYIPARQKHSWGDAGPVRGVAWGDGVRGVESAKGQTKRTGGLHSAPGPEILRL